ncbi:MAG: vanB3 [Rhodospirillales bacterium]|nr:vanB3 [Rhodospirillales bacterium]
MVVAETRLVAEAVREFRLRPAEPHRVAEFVPGAHVQCEVTLPGGDKALRAYSLLNAPHDRDGYVIAVARAEDGAGGSAFLHGVAPGTLLAVTEPKNDFPLSDDAGEHLLLAGGIGITPLLAMARTLTQRGAKFHLTYAGRRPAAMAYHDEVQALPNATVICDGGDPRNGVDLAALLAGPRRDLHFYVCGPRKLIEAALTVARAQGWAESNLHFELFSADATRSGDVGFTVEIQSTGQTLQIPHDRTILDVLIEAGLDPIYDCKRGECGICVTEIADGVPDHRDMTLSQREKDEGKSLCTCVSRAKSSRLVLKL